MPLSKEAMREYIRERREGVIPNLENIIPKYPFMDWLVDPVKRNKLEKICLSAKNHRTLDEIRLGVRGPTLTTMAELLDATL